MNDFVISASKVKTLTDCKKRFFHEYILKDVERVDSPFADMGTVIHEILEQLRHDKNLTKRDLINEFHTNFNPPNRFDFLRGHGTKIINDLDYKKVFIGKLIGTEITFEEDLGNVKIRGIIDKVEDVNGEIVITDYKTNQKANPNEYMHQLVIYELAAKKLYGDKPVKHELYYLRHDKKFPFRIRENVKNDTIKLLNEMKDYVLEHNENSKRWEKLPKKNTKVCNYCQLKDKCWK